MLLITPNRCLVSNFMELVRACLMALGILMFMGACSNSTKKAPHSDHFDGERFHNVERVDHGLGSVLKWLTTRDGEKWPEWVESTPGETPKLRVGGGEAVVTLINHATFLIQTDSLNILTDPVWSRRVSPVSFAGPKRVRAPGLRLDQLPPIDAVLISHNHYDHVDLPTLRKLAKRNDPKVFCPLGVESMLSKAGFSEVIAMDWWQSAALTPQGIDVTFVPARHFSGRGLFDRNKSLWGGFVLQSSLGPIYFGGDTGYSEHFRQIREKFGPMRLSLLPIGAYEPRWFMSPVHINPAEAVTAHIDLQSGLSLGMHFGTFPLADEGFDQPLRDLETALDSLGVDKEIFFAPDFGKPVFLEGAEGIRPYGSFERPPVIRRFDFP